MGHIANGVIDLPLIERAARPVGEAGTLVDLDAEPAIHQIGVADLLPLTERHGGDLRVEHGMRRLAGEIVDDLDVLAASVEDLQHILIVHEQVEQRLKIELGCLRIDRGRFFGVGDLDQAEFRPVRVLPHELGIDAHERGVGETGAQIGESGAVGDERVNVHKRRPIDPRARVDKEGMEGEGRPIQKPHRPNARRGPATDGPTLGPGPPPGWCI